MSDEKKEIAAKDPVTVVRRWELLISILMFGITSAVQSNIIPEGQPTRIAMWAVSVLAQVGIIFGRPLLWRGANQTVPLLNNALNDVQGDKKNGD